jgi:hypothetical protein
LLGTNVRSPQDQLLGSVENLVRSPQTYKIAYFKMTANANLLVLNATKGPLDGAPRVAPFTTSGIDLQSQKVDAYWKARLSN